MIWGYPYFWKHPNTLYNAFEFSDYLVIILCHPSRAQEFVTLAMSSLAVSIQQLLSFWTFLIAQEPGGHPDVFCQSEGWMRQAWTFWKSMVTSFFVARSSVLICLMRQQRHTGHVHATLRAEMDFLKPRCLPGPC